MDNKILEKTVFSDSFKEAFMLAFMCAIDASNKAIKSNSDPVAINKWGKTVGILTAFCEMLGMYKENGHD